MLGTTARQETEKSARNNLAQDLLLLGQWKQGWHYYRHRFERKPGRNYPCLLKPSGHPSGFLKKRPLLLMVNKGSRHPSVQPLYPLPTEGFDVTLLSQPALVPLLQEAVGITNVVDSLNIEAWQARQPVWMPLLNVLPNLQDESS